MIEIATKIIKSDEESNVFKTKPYYCSEDYPTIGWGFRIPGTKRNDPLPPITMSQVDGDKKLAKMLRDYHKELSTHINTTHIYPKLNEVRQAVLLSMRHQLGMDGLVNFRKMWVALEAQDYIRAAGECLDSKAAKQAPKRFSRNAQMLSHGELLSHYK
jgi:lysozyme